MNKERLILIRQLFDEALLLPQSERESFLNLKCANDSELKNEIISLLNSLENTEDFLEEQVTDVSEKRDSVVDPFIGKQIGNYIIDGKAGIGGMGVVYSGKRNDKSFKQKAAIKILRHGLNSDYHLKRFLIERQTLASLQYPFIARLLDGGQTDEGLPYLVMEYIDGIPITEYCNQHDLSIRDRLKLFRDVCSAVQYAHQNLIVHRDIKPGNILVTNEGQVKLLDFGIAKLLDENMFEDAEGLTKTGVWHLTPEYASPEQIKGEAITTASDIYSLGVMLYQILTKEQPYKITNNSPSAISKMITEENIIKPSERVRRTITNLELKETDDKAGENNSKLSDYSEKLFHHLKGDLDNIVLKAMHKDSARRYVSVEQFSEDIRRHLVGLPVIAQKDTARYRLSKFIQRHKKGFVASAIFLIFMVASLVVIIWQANVAANERDIAKIEADKFERVNMFLQNMLSSVDPDEIGRDVKVYDVLGRAAENVESELKDKPEIEAAIRRTLGNTYTNLGEYEQAKEHLEKALLLNRKIYGNENEKVAVNLYDLALYYHWIGDLKNADSLYNYSLAIFRNTLKEPTRDLAVTLNGCALIQSDLGNYSLAVKQFEEALLIIEQKYGKEDKDYSSIINNLAITMHSLNQLDKAEKYYLESQRIVLKLFGEKRTEIASTYNNLAFIYLDKNDFVKAEENFVKSYNLKLELKGKDHPDVGLALSNLGSVKLKQKDYKEAIDLFNRAIIQLKKTLPDVHAWLANSYYGLGRTLYEMGDFINGEINLRHSLQIRKNIFSEDNPVVYFAEGELGICLLGQNKLSEAETLLVKAYNGISTIDTGVLANTQRFAEHLLKLYKLKNDKEKIQSFKNILQNLSQK